jgi:hypothetical protein
LPLFTINPTSLFRWGEWLLDEYVPSTTEPHETQDIQGDSRRSSPAMSAKTAAFE